MEPWYPGIITGVIKKTNIGHGHGLLETILFHWIIKLFFFSVWDTYELCISPINCSVAFLQWKTIKCKIFGYPSSLQQPFFPHRSILWINHPFWCKYKLILSYIIWNKTGNPLYYDMTNWFLRDFALDNMHAFVDCAKVVVRWYTAVQLWQNKSELNVPRLPTLMIGSSFMHKIRFVVWDWRRPLQ